MSLGSGCLVDWVLGGVFAFDLGLGLDFSEGRGGLVSMSGSVFGLISPWREARDGSWSRGGDVSESVSDLEFGSGSADFLVSESDTGLSSGSGGV